MIMIPLPYVFALAALVGVIWEWSKGENRNLWMVAFLTMLAVQEAVIGTRFGYGIASMGRFQPLVAALVPPLAYLGFRKPEMQRGVWIHTLPFMAVIVAMSVLIDMLDVVLAANNFLYVVLLILLGLRGSDALDWVPFGGMRKWRVFLWLVVALLVFSGLTDALISLDFQANGGANTARIVGIASAIGFPLVAGMFLFAKGWRDQVQQHEDPATNAKDVETFEIIERLMAKDRVYIDPDINLKRIAQRLSKPSRDVSRAINAMKKQNVSQYINSLRTKEACRMLRETKMPIIEIVYASGYNTKSNFHREFTRNTGMTPSQWRKTA